MSIMQTLEKYKCFRANNREVNSDGRKEFKGQCPFMNPKEKNRNKMLEIIT